MHIYKKLSPYYYMKWGIAIYIIFRHLLALYAILQVHITFMTACFAIFMYIFSGFGVTAGAHRYWSHRSYTITTPMEWLLITMFATADQGTISDWALTHATHHRYSDLNGDPHNRSLGLWWSHIAWTSSSKSWGLPIILYDQVENHISWRAKLYDTHSLWAGPVFALIIPAITASTWGDTSGGFWIAGCLRWAIVLNFSFSVNSLAHKTSKDGTTKPIDSTLVSILSLGEGCHKQHHDNPSDYRAGNHLYNPTKLFIDGCNKLGMVKYKNIVL